MTTSDIRTPGTGESRGALTRRALLGRAGLVIGLAGVSALAAACGAAPAATPTTAPQPTAVPPTPPPPPTVAPTATAVPQPTVAPTATLAPQPTVAPTSTAVAAATPTVVVAPTAAAASPTAQATGAANVVNVGIAPGTEFKFQLDRLEIPAGEVTFKFTNGGKLSHDLMVYPQQDFTQLLKLRRKGTDADEGKFVKEMAGMLDAVEPGKTEELKVKLTPGQWELGCTAMGKNPDGSTFVHFDRGQFATLKVAAGAPAEAKLAPTLAVEMKGEETGSWLFIPDKLVVPAGNVTFMVKNSMKEEHDFSVHQLGDVSGTISAILSGKMSEDDAVDKMLEELKGQKLLEDLPSGKTNEKSMKLTPGLWCAACYMVSKGTDGASFIHRDRGQRFVFLVK